MGMLEDFAQAVQKWGAKNVADPVRSGAARVGANWQAGYTDPFKSLGGKIENFAEAIQRWGKTNVADVVREGGNPFLTADGKNAVAEFWRDLIFDWTYAQPREAERAAADAGMSMDQLIASLNRSDEAKFANQRGLAPTSPVTGAIEGEVTPTPAPGSASGTGTTAGGAATGPGTVPTDESLAAPGTPRQIPGGGEVWRIDGGAVYLAYTIPGTDKKMVWHVENSDRLTAIFGDGPVVYDKELTRDEFRAISPWRGGLSAELVNTSEDPWQQFMSDFQAAAELRPWLTDPSVQAVMAVAYLEGRAPTSDELATTDWWNNHTADERAWMESSATVGREEVERRRADAILSVEEKIRESGMSAPSSGVVEYIARQRLTGKWSETYAAQQIAKLADPFASGQLDRGLLAVVRNPNQGSAADAAAIADGKPAVIRRLRQVFANARVPIATDTETEEARLNRIADEVINGGRTMSDVRQSIDLLAMKTEGGQIGGLQTTAKGEDEVRRLAQTWLGPVHGELSPDQIARWAGRLRNDPSGNVAQELEGYLKQQRLALFPEYENENLTYEDIVTPWRNYLTQQWGTQVDIGDETLIEVARKNDIGEAGRIARQIGLERNYEPVVNDFATGMLSAFGGGVRRAI